MTLYAIQPNPATGSLDDAEVVSQSKHGWDLLEQAITLWRPVDTDRANELAALVTQIVKTAGDGELRLNAEDLRELIRLLSNVEKAIVDTGIVNKDWRVAPERLEVLARQVPAMDLKTERSQEDKTDALGEIMSNAIFLRNFLSGAANAGCIVVQA